MIETKPKQNVCAETKLKVGDRFGAILTRREHLIFFLGYGTYDGHEIPPSYIGGLGPLLNALQISNPKITLDNGKVIWGCECWWSSADIVQKLLDTHVVIDIGIDEARGEYHGYN